MGTPSLDLALWQTRYHDDLVPRQHASNTAPQFAAALTHFFDYLGGVGVRGWGDLTPDVAQAYRTHAHAGALHHPHPDWTATHQLLAVRTFLRFLHQAGHHPVDLGAPVRWFPPSDWWSGVRLTPVEVEAILLAPDVRHPVGLRDRAVLEVWYSTGLRPLELRRLQLGAAGALTVTGKDGCLRPIPPGPSARWLHEYLTNVRPHWVQTPGERTVFLTPLGVPLTRMSLEVLVTAAVQATGIEKWVSLCRFREARRAPTATAAKCS